MAIPVIMPKQGQSVESCIITRWFKEKGDPVQFGDILFTYETDKASFDVESKAEGILVDIFFKDGDEVPVLTNVAVIGKKDEDIDAFRPGKLETYTKSNITTIPVIADVASHKDRIRISPRAKNMAEKMGINFHMITGTGPNGRIIARDIEIIDSEKSRAGTVAPRTHSSYADHPVSNIRKIIAKAMHESISSSAQLTHHMSADARKILALRSMVKAQAGKGINQDITINDMVCFATIKALLKFPDMNSHFLGDTIRVFDNVHLGLAVDTNRGLMVPSVKDADGISLRELSIKLRKTADQCRKGNIDPELLSAKAATFTVSNLGNYGVEMFTPIINLPQVAILGINTITLRPGDLGDGVFGFIPMIGLSLTYDHRAVDGGPATLFLKEIRDQIVNFNYPLS